MEEKYRLLVSCMLGLFVSTSLVSAITLSAPSQVNSNENFKLIISHPPTGLYILEITIPQAFQIISDPSGGERTGDLYKTGTSGGLTLGLRGVQAGTYEFSGIYGNGPTQGSLNSKEIIVKQKQIALLCPVCPGDSQWSNCEQERKIRLVYSCSPATNYQCLQTTQMKSCQTQTPSVSGGSGSGSSTITNSVCQVGWTCTDEKNLAYQSSDCSLSSIQRCSEGCENNECSVKQEIKDQHPQETLSIAIDPPTMQPTPTSIFSRVGDLIRNILNFLMFWN